MRKIVCFLCFLVIFTSCSFFDQQPYVKFNGTDFQEAQKKWSNLQPENYSFSYSIFNDATGPTARKVTVTVEDGNSSFVVSCENESEEETYSGQDEENDFPTVDSLFDFIKKVYNEDLEFVSKKPDGVDCYELSVSYDSETGLPLEIENTLWSDGSWDGGWYKIIISDFGILNESSEK